MVWCEGGIEIAGEEGTRIILITIAPDGTTTTAYLSLVPTD